MGSFSIGHWLVVLAIVAIVFGAGRLPVPPSQAEAPTWEELSESITPPVNVETEIEGLRSRLRNAEVAILSGDAPLALELIGEVENGLASLQHEHGEDIPPGHVGLLVLEEKLVYLKREARELQAGAE